MSPIPNDRRGGFTLIEVMAVVIVIGLALGIVLPNLSANRGAELEEHARGLASRLVLARERAIVTGAAHRVFLNLENGTTRVDWHVSEERAFAHLEDPYAPGGALPDPNTGKNYSDTRAISLSPPEREERDYFPVPNRFGNEDWLPPDIFFEGVNTPDGWIEEGSVQIVFRSDGSTDFSEIVLRDTWQNRVVLEVEPLLETVRIRREEGS